MMRGGQGGFTLVEALVAFAILAVMMVAGLQLAGTGLRAIDAAATTEGAVLVAQSQMDRIVAMRAVPQERRGQLDGTPYAWEIEILPLDPAALRQPQARKPVHVRLFITWRGRGGLSRIHLDRIVFTEETALP